MAAIEHDRVTHGPADRTARMGPWRRCIVTGEVHRKAELLRFVVGPDGRIVPDVAGRLPGRGLWLSPSRNVVKTACDKKAFARAARRAVETPDNLDDLAERLLARRLQEGLALARRAGVAVAGHEKVRAVLRSGPVGVLFAAADAGTDGQARRRALLDGHAAGTPALIACLSGSELGVAFGRDRAVHVAVRPGKLAERLVADAARLAGFRAAVPAAPRVRAEESDQYDAEQRNRAE
jgi:predicted RNA-binding protein YlxR (DUF448 family)